MPLFGQKRFGPFAVCILLWAAQSCVADDSDYVLGPDSQRQADVPRGIVTQHHHVSPEIYSGAERDYWIYIPAQYVPTKPVCLMVFQDGGGYVKEDGSNRVPVVFDNLIHKGEMPVTIGVFVNPGVIPAVIKNSQPRKNRSFEYDSLGDRYSRFLLNELLKPIEARYNISKNPDDRAIAGVSSGAICAWTVAWERPDQFRKVLSEIGSFTNIRGGHNYHAMIRKTEKKPIRIFMQEGENDLDNLHGNWPLANRQMAASLDFAKYDYKLVMGTGRHSRKHGGAILPDSLRWLWRNHEGLAPKKD